MPPAKRKRPATSGEDDVAPGPKRAFGNNASTTQNIPPPTETEGKSTDLGKARLGSEELKVPSGPKTQERVLLQNTPAIRPRRETQVSEDADGKTWICICRSVVDLGRERDAADYDRIKISCAEEGKCMCMQAADAHPNHPWIVTKAGYALYKEWKHQIYCRDPDNFGMYITSKWDGYGASEVVENTFLAFNREVRKSKKQRDPLVLWSHIEGMALFLDRACYGFHGIEGSAKRIMLIGTALLTAIDILIERKLFGHGSTEIRNLGLILCHFLRFAHDYKDLCRKNENGWQHFVSNKARRHQVVLKGLYDIDKITINLTSGGIVLPEQGGDDLLDSIKNTQSSYEDPWPVSGVLTLESLNPGTERTWRFIDWKFEVQSYRDNRAVKVGTGLATYGGNIGGKFYDLTAARNKGRHMQKYKVEVPQQDIEASTSKTRTKKQQASPVSSDHEDGDDYTICPGGRPVKYWSKAIGGRCDKRDCETVCGESDVKIRCPGGKLAISYSTTNGGKCSFDCRCGTCACQNTSIVIQGNSYAKVSHR